MHPVIRLHPDDNVVIARTSLMADTPVADGITTSVRIPAGHKVAVRPIAQGEPVRCYSQVIGFATADIAPGQHVHVHNMGMGEFAKDYAYSRDAKPTDYVEVPATFEGIRRPDGRVATRNYIGILTSVNCSAHVASLVADAFKRHPFTGFEPLADYPNVDGVVALTHKTGCGMPEGEPLQLLRRTLAGYARHPNFSHIVVLGLGCEVNQIGAMLKEHNLTDRIRNMDIQAMGGTRKTVEAGMDFVRQVLVEANHVHRETVPASELKVALQCGGSDGYSGVSANPALGVASDLVVRNGGTVILSETTETYGAEHLFTRRAVSQEVGERLVELMKWWEEYTRKHGAEINANPSPGNKAGGLTTILEKSLGAMAKAGSTNLVDVIKYADPVTAKGFVFMDTPGFDPVSATGQVAGGANVVCFTTGRGSVFGCKPAPSINIATNTPLFTRMGEDMDLNCGTILDGEESVQQAGKRIFDNI
ncbi:MAG: altronate dehydratase family protein, partial [Chloroflexota bacterium]|nr:altronate dehydratase family protein [Chloroflexota bacterium]